MNGAEKDASRDSLGDRMKEYEGVTDLRLTRRVPVIGRLDGMAFHTLTRKLEKPWDERFVAAMISTADVLLRNVPGCRLMHVASDEISMLLTDYARVTTDAWFGYAVEKMCSASAAIASVEFSRAFGEPGCFDARFFNVPMHEVSNYFLWRQRDAARNSLSGLAQKHYSHKELEGKKSPQMHDMLMAKGVNWNDTPTHLKRGVCLYRACGLLSTDMDPPEVTKDRGYFERHVYAGDVIGRMSVTAPATE